MALIKKGLGRGLSALIPDAEMDALSDITRESTLVSAPPSTPKKKQPAQDAGALTKNRRVSPLPASKATQEVTGRASSIKKKAETPQAFAGAPTEEAGEKEVSKQEISKQGDLQTTFAIAINSIVPNPYQPRRTFDEAELEDLAASIRLHGILQPILVRPANEKADGHYQLVAGERRWRAARLAGIEKVPAIVRPMADQQALELALIENVQRHDISAIDAAVAYERLGREFKLSQEQISRRVGKSRSAVANTLRLLDLPQEARKAIEEGELTEGHGRAILLASGEGARRAIFRRVVRDKLSVRESERLARAASQDYGNESEQPNATSKTSIENEWSQAERDFTKKLGASVKIKSAAKHGTIVIECGNPSEIRRVLVILQGDSQTTFKTTDG